MKKLRILSILLLGLCTCAPQPKKPPETSEATKAPEVFETPKTPRINKAPVGWPIFEWSEADFRDYLDRNRRSLDLIEGIWTYSVMGMRKDVQSGAVKHLPRQILYRIAIIRDPSSSTYEYVAVNIECDHPAWKPGMVKARFRKTAYKGIYEALWFRVNFKPIRRNWFMEHDGLLTDKFTAPDRKNPNMEMTLKFMLLKAYPPFRR